MYGPLEFPHTFTIPTGADGSAVAAVDLGYNWDTLLITCEDCSHIPGTTTLSAQVSPDGTNALCDLYKADTPDTKWVSGNLPTSGTLAFVLTHAKGARRLRLILSKVTVGGSAVFKIYPQGSMYEPA